MGTSWADGNCSSRFPTICSTAATFLAEELPFETRHMSTRRQWRHLLRGVILRHPQHRHTPTRQYSAHYIRRAKGYRLFRFRNSTGNDPPISEERRDRSTTLKEWGKKKKKSFNFAARKMLKPLKSITSKTEAHTSRLVKLTVVVSQRQGAGATAVTRRRSCLNWE